MKGLGSAIPCLALLLRVLLYELQASAGGRADKAARRGGLRKSLASFARDINLGKYLCSERAKLHGRPRRPSILADALRR